ncbi:MAG: TetR family transcriptional regulator [Dehalococcoidia bacterium]|nr:TetR family transcriptional regulator [Dehalococcoidia bacterium]
MAGEQVRSQQRHERILDAAIRVFSRRGYHDSTVDEIAIESETSKGGFYFHFPNKQAIFLALLDRMAAMLRSRAEKAIDSQLDPISKADSALRVAFETFADHPRLTRLFLVESMGTGRDFHERLAAARSSFAELIEKHLDEAVAQGAIPPLDTAIASRVWFGALNEVVTAWVLADPPGDLQAAYPTIRYLLFQSVGVHAVAPVPALPATNGGPA